MISFARQNIIKMLVVMLSLSSANSIQFVVIMGGTNAAGTCTVNLEADVLCEQKTEQWTTELF